MGEAEETKPMNSSNCECEVTVINTSSSSSCPGRWSPSSGGLQSSQQENRRGPLIAVATAAEAVETKPVNLSNCAAVTVITPSSPSSSCPVIEISSSNVINPPNSLSETSAALVVVRHSSCDPGAPLALI